MSKHKKSHKSADKAKRLEVAFTDLALDELETQLGLPLPPVVQRYNYNSGTSAFTVFGNGFNEAQIVSYAFSSTINIATPPVTTINVYQAGDVVAFGTLASSDQSFTKLTVGAYMSERSGTADTYLQASIFATQTPLSNTMTQISPVCVLSPGADTPTPAYLSGEIELDIFVPAGTYFAVVFQLVDANIDDAVQAKINAVIEYYE